MKMLQRVVLACSVGLFVLGSGPQIAHAQDGMQVDHFDVMSDPSNNTLNVLGSSLLPHLGFNGGMFFHFIQAPLKVIEQQAGDNDTRRNLIDNQFKGEVWLSFGLEDVVDFGLVVPMTFSQAGSDLGPAGQPGVTPDGFALGDIRFTPKARILDYREFWGLGLSVAVPIFIPTGDETTFNGEGAVRWEPRLIVDYTMENVFSVAANLGYQFRSSTSQVGANIVRDDMFRWSLGARAGLGVDGLEALASVFGSVQTESDLGGDNNRNTPMEVLAGVQWQLPWAPVLASLGGGAGISGGVGSPEFRVFLSVGYVPYLKDRDNDGVVDRDDQCMDSPEDIDGFNDTDGCPDDDNDEDGIADAKDTCPDDAEDADGFEDTDGCPDSDNDGDEIADANDACPDTPEDVDGFEDSDGCPEDNDGDGIADADDGCVNEAEDIDGFEDTDGCPDTDNDKDGIPDTADLCRDNAEDMDNFADDDGCPDFDNDIDGFCDPWVATSGMAVTVCQGTDKCPDEKEVINGVEDNDGCPDEGKSLVQITVTEIVILDRVFFDTGKAKIKKKSFPLLDQVAAVLATNPQITKIEIQGHTDNRGKPEKNKKLSQDRANSVMKYLNEKGGIDAARLTAVGYGQDEPIADNKNKKGRAANRRVQFKVVEVDGKPVTKVE